MHIYICGPITGQEDTAVARFEEVEKVLLAKGHTVVNPTKLPHLHDKKWESYMRECITELMKCDGIAVMDNFKDSKGCKLEIKIALELGIIFLFTAKNEVVFIPNT